MNPEQRRSLRAIITELQNQPYGNEYGNLVRELIEKLESLGIPV